MPEMMPAEDKASKKEAPKRKKRTPKADTYRGMPGMVPPPTHPEVVESMKEISQLGADPEVRKDREELRKMGADPKAKATSEALRKDVADAEIGDEHIIETKPVEEEDFSEVSATLERLAKERARQEEVDKEFGHLDALPDAEEEKDPATVQQELDTEYGHLDKPGEPDSAEAQTADAEWAAMKAGAKNEGIEKMRRRTADGKEKQRVTRLRKAETEISKKESAKIAQVRAEIAGSDKAVKETELDAVSRMSIPEFSADHHKELAKRQGEIVDQLAATSRWNIFKRRSLQKELEQVTAQMDLTSDRYAELKRDLARAQKDAMHGDINLRKVYALEVKKLESELKPYEEIVSKATFDEAGDRQAVKHGDKDIMKDARRIARGGPAATSKE